LTLEENEELVAWALKEFPDLQLEVPSTSLGRPGVIVPGLTPDHAKKLIRFGDPQHIDSLDDTIGFFIAKFTMNQ
jgi:16S rRNA C967 or C1407 C5-methylase (RsmB/RsmF family)